MTAAWRWIQEINNTCHQRKPRFESDLGLLDMGDTWRSAAGSVEGASKMIERMHDRGCGVKGWAMRTRALERRTMKSTGVTVERWEYLRWLEREKEQERLEKEASAQGRGSAGGGRGGSDGG